MPSLGSTGVTRLIVDINDRMQENIGIFAVVYNVIH